MVDFIANLKLLSIASDFAQTATGIVAVCAALYFYCQKRTRRKALEQYLIVERKSAESPGGKGTGARSIVHLMGRCSMTESQVLEAAFANKKVKTWIAADPDTGLAETLMFRIDDKAWGKIKA